MIPIAAYFAPHSPAVLNFLFFFPFLRRVVGDTALSRTLPAMRLSASKRTPQITAPYVTRMGQEENPAMTAPAQAPPQIRAASQKRPQHGVILLYQNTHLAFAVPIGVELEMLLDFYDDKPRFSLMILMLLNTSLSYPIDASVSRG
jgi:hypothetical protein